MKEESCYPCPKCGGAGYNVIQKRKPANAHSLEHKLRMNLCTMCKGTGAVKECVDDEEY